MKSISIGLLCLATIASFGYQNNLGRLKGKVVDLDGQTVADVQLTVTYIEGGPADFSKTITSRKTGSFVLMGLESGIVQVEGSKQGFNPGKMVYRQEQNNYELVFLMIPEGSTPELLSPQPSAKGSVFNSQGEPIPNVGITMSTKAFPELKREVVSDDQGQFKIETLANAEVELYARKEGYNDQIFSFLQGKKDYKVKTNAFVMKTIEEAYAEQGLEVPVEKELTPEEKAVEAYNLAVDPYQNKDYESAERFALQAHEMDPKQEQALKLLVYSNRQLNDWNDVLTYSEKYIALFPEDKKMPKYAMEAASMTDNKAKVKEYRKKVRDIVGVTPQSLFSEAVAALNSDDDATATARLNEILKMDSKHAHAYLELGKIKIREGEFEEAIKNLRTYLKYAKPNDKYREEATDLIVTLSE